MRSLIAVVFILLTHISAANSAGVFDFLDPCIAAKNDYWDARNGVMESLAREKSLVSTEVAPSEFRDFWWAEKKKLLRKYFDENFGSVVKAGGGNADRAFEVWLATEIKKQGGMAAVDPLIQKEFRNTKTLLLEKKQGATQAKLDEAKGKLYSGCPQDVGNQVFRGAVTILTAPVDVMKGNFDAAGRESGDVDKLLRAITGVSVKDIKSHGVCGGSNSEMRKLFGSLC